MNKALTTLLDDWAAQMTALGVPDALAAVRGVLSAGR